MLQGGGREGYPNEWGPFTAGNELAVHHVSPMEMIRIYATALGSVLNDQDHYPLRSANRRRDFRQAHHVVSQPVAALSLVNDIGLY